MRRTLLLLWSTLGACSDEASQEARDGGTMADDGSMSASIDASTCPEEVLPSQVSHREICGDARLVAANSPYQLTNVRVLGDLHVEPGVVITVSHDPSSPVSQLGGIVADGTAHFGSGSVLECSGEFAPLVAGTLVAAGDASASVEIRRAEGANNQPAYCRVQADRVELRFAAFVGVSLTVGSAENMSADGTIEDSTFDGQGLFALDDQARLYVWWHGHDSATSLIHYNSFRHTSLRGHAFTAQANVFADSELYLCTSCISWRACDGDRSLDPDVVFSGNSIEVDPDKRYIVSIDRDYGAVDLSQNYWNPFPEAEQLDAFDGTPSGCADELGAYGGPLQLTPSLSVAPIAGPRS